MSTLSLIWVTALIIMVGIIIYARHEDAQRKYVTNGVFRLRDLASKEAHLLLRDAMLVLQHMRPHGERALTSGLIFVRRGQDFFIARVYGKIKVHKGSASSFFLKQIREHQGRGMERAEGSRQL